VSTASTTPQRHSSSQIHGITIWLDTYDDIFSDFDPREYQGRALSDDFLNELRKLVREDDAKESLREIQLLIPGDLRSAVTEEVISHRLHTYFRHRLQQLTDEYRRIRRKGIWLSLSGMICLLIASYISFGHPAQLGYHILRTMLEPAGWFFVWMGYDHLVNGFARRKSDLDFHKRISRNKIFFRSL
jgi:hypothetical protein